MLKYVKFLRMLINRHIFAVSVRHALFEMLEMKKLSRKQFGILFNVIRDCGSKFLDNIGKRFVSIDYDFRFGRAKISVTYMANCTYFFPEGAETLNTLIQFDCMFEQDANPERYVIRPIEVISGDRPEKNIFDFLSCPLKVEEISEIDPLIKQKGGVTNETETQR